MDVALSAPQEAHYRADVSYLLKQGARGLWYSGLGLHQLGSRPTFYIPRWTAHLYILPKGRAGVLTQELLIGP